MSREELLNLERLMNYVAYQYLKKISWEDVSKTEWTYIVHEFNAIIEKQQRSRKISAAPSLFGDNYFYEHLIIRKLKAAKNNSALHSLGSPNFSKLNVIAVALGFGSYIDFINNSTEVYPFHELKINVPLATVNQPLLDHLVGYWYCYNRNLPFKSGKKAAERIWRSSLEIYKSGEEYLVERTGRDNHMYYGKITSYANYIFIIMNSTTFIRQRHFIGRLKDVEDNMKRPGYVINELNFVSTCVSFNEEPIALYEIFHRVAKLKDFEKTSVDLAFDSPLLPKHILLHLKDSEQNRIMQH
ncbi:hypothetical protein [Chitinophaga arvensicola]|uniref:Uncharacterized protein n=1 Tax=Chitinophaga arvensicola TaxID=29529 RepID=A0A1I0QW27_9BACT|nr:hypothetical protein [Chitinophaga arvensicola]SEW31904.1 hypothetical protein SAMN04488122_1815 [Chitinophaga arvensicola]